LPSSSRQWIIAPKKQIDPEAKMIPHIQNKRWLLLLVMSAAMMMLLWLLFVVTGSHAQIEPERSLAVGGSHLGFTGASTSDDLVIFDMAKGAALSPTLNLLPEGNYPFDATLNADRSQIWLAGASGDGLVVIDALTPAVIRRIPNIGDWPIDIVFSEEGQFAYVSMRNEAEDIKIIDTTTYISVGVIPIPDYYLGSGKMRLNHCTGELYAVNYFDSHFFVINPISQTVTSEMTFGDNLWDLTIDPAATTLYIADRGTPDAVHLFDIATLTTTASIAVGTDPWGIDATPDGRYVLVANQGTPSIPGDSTVSVIDTSTNAVTTTVTLAADADARDIEINAEGTLAYVTSGEIAGADAVYVIDLATFQVVDTIFAPATGGSNTNVVAVAPDFPSLDPAASFTTTTPVETGAPIQFFDTTTNNPTAWHWDFGDGLGNSTLQNPLYTYANSGTYTVTLTAESHCGTDSVQSQVTVKQSFHYRYLPFIGKD
jgi:YVTN family beta-propeller protein